MSAEMHAQGNGFFGSLDPRLERPEHFGAQVRGSIHPMMAACSVTIAVHDELEELAGASGRSRASVIREAIDFALAHDDFRGQL